MSECPICKTGSPQKDAAISGFQVWRCGSCNLFWVPGVSDAVLKDFYTGEYFRSSEGILGYHDYVEDEEILRLNARYIISNIPAPKNAAPNVLDIGCAYGFTLDEFRKAGWNCYGVEMSKEAADYAQNKLQIKNVFNGTLRAANHPSDFFDAVVIVGTIEHLPDPVDVIREVSRILKPGGKIAITTIDTEGLVRLYELKPPEHLYYFSKRNLARLLQNFHFKVLRTAPYWCHYHLSEALCRAFRLVFHTELRIEKFTEKVPFLKTAMKVPTNEMFMLAEKTAEPKSTPHA